MLYNIAKRKRNNKSTPIRVQSVQGKNKTGFVRDASNMKLIHFFRTLRQSVGQEVRKFHKYPLKYFFSVPLYVTGHFFKASLKSNSYLSIIVIRSFKGHIHSKRSFKDNVY